MKRVLLTGATGFVGRACLPVLLEAGYEVHAVSARPVVDVAPGVIWYQADLLQHGACRQLLQDARPTHLLHLAWCATVPGVFWTSPENLDWLRASVELLQEFQSGGGSRIVGVGTCAEYDWSDGICRESTTAIAPASPYGQCKHALHLALEFNSHGPHEHQQRLVPSVIKNLLAGESARCSAGAQQRDYLQVHDVATALVTLLSSDVAGAVNVGSGQAVAVSDLVECIGEIVGRPELIQLGAVPSPASEAPLVVADMTRLKNEVGWTPRYDMRRGLEATVEWWRRPSATEPPPTPS